MNSIDAKPLTSKPSILPHWDGKTYTAIAAPIYDLVTTLTGWKAQLSSALDGLPLGTLLDVGCGTGSLLKEAQARGFTATGIDPSAGMLDKARGVFLPTSGELLQCSATALPFVDNSYDVCISTGCLVHVPEVALAASEMQRVVKPGGRIRIIDHAKPQQRQFSTLAIGLFSQLSGDILHDYPAVFCQSSIESGHKTKSCRLIDQQTLGRGGYLQMYDFLVEEVGEQ